MKSLMLFGITCVFFVFIGNTQDCPEYLNTAIGTQEVCGEQSYRMMVNNSHCARGVYFDYSGNLGIGTFDGYVRIISELTGDTVLYELGNGTFSGSIGPIDASVQGTVFDMLVFDGDFTVSQNGNVIANVPSTGYAILHLEDTISSATLTVQTPSGDIAKTIVKCKDFIVKIPLSNSNFCNILNVDLPWEIVCDDSGLPVASGIHSVVVYPQAPTDPSDLVDINWNAGTCSWDVSPNYDCTASDIGSVFDISPDPTTGPDDVCIDGDQVFTVDYIGIPNGSDCCFNAGSLAAASYYDTIAPNEVGVTTSSPTSSATHNAAYIQFPPNNIGGNAIHLDLCLDIADYCMDYDYTPEYSFKVYLDGDFILSEIIQGKDLYKCFTLTDIPGYNQNSEIEVYIFPGVHSFLGTLTTFRPDKSCNDLSYLEWSADITATINVEFEDMIGTPLSCTEDLTSTHTNCTPPKPDVVLATPADCNTTSTLSVTNFDNSLTYNISPSGASINSSGIISGNADDYTVTVDNGNCTNDEDFTIDPEKPVPTFTVNHTDPTVCGGTDGTITFKGLYNNTDYDISYDTIGTVGPTTFTSNGVGEIIIIGLNAENYTNFNVDLNGCIEIDNSNIILKDPAAPIVDAGPDIEVCLGMKVTLIADNPDGALITWSNNVKDGTEFVPPIGTTEYTVSVDLGGCTNSDQMFITVLPSITDITCPDGLSATCDISEQPVYADFNAFIAAGGSASIPTGGEIDSTYFTLLNEVSDGNSCPELVTRTYQISDICGVTASCTQTITINVDTDPTASNPAPITVECLSDVPAEDIAVVTDVEDNCTASPTVAFESESSDGNTCNGEEITRVYSVTDNCGNSIDVTQIIIIDSYTPSFTVSSTNPTTCDGNDGTILISGLDASSDYEMGYNGGGGNVITTNALGEYVIAGLLEGVYVGFTVSDANCPACSKTENVKMTLADPAPPSVNAGPDIEVCEGRTVTLTADNPDGANISWDKGAVDGEGFTPAIGTINYTVTAELVNCFSSDVASVTVHPLPIVSAGNDVEVCEGEKVTLSESGADTYSWDNGIINGVSFIPTLGTTTYTLVGTTIYGCTDSDEVNVIVHSTPVVSFETDITEGCAPVEINLKSLTGGTSNECRFTINGGVEVLGCNINHTFNSAGCYDINLKVETVNGCVNDSTAYDYICVDDYPIADFTVNPEELSFFDHEVIFNNESEGAETYEWSFGDGEYSNVRNPDHVYSVNEVNPESAYEIELIAFSQLGCTDTVQSILPYFEELLYYVPNSFTPDNDQYNETFKPVFTAGFDPLMYNLKIFNRWGQVIFESNNAANGWDGSYGTSTIEFAPTGVYIWKINFKKERNDVGVEEVGHVNLLR